MFGIGLALWVACSPKSDSELYTLALSKQNPALCLEILNGDVQGDCMTAVIEAAPSSTENESFCARLESEKWKGECHFQLSDANLLVGEKAKVMCQKAGEFSEDCLRHAAARDVEQHIHLAELKQAQNLLPRIYGIVKNYLVDSIAQPMARDMLVRMVAAYQPNTPFSAEYCRGLTPDTCVQIYIVRSLGSGQQDDTAWRGACGSEMTPRLAVSLGWANYHPAQQSVVNKAWRQVCQSSP